MSAASIGGGSQAEAVRRVGLELIRAAVRRAVERSSLRGVAMEVGMSPTGLQGFIDGTQPYGKTKEKLRVWYAMHQDDSDPELAAETALGLVEALLRGVPDRRRAAAREGVLRAFAEAFEAADVTPPAWTDVARREADPAG